MDTLIPINVVIADRTYRIKTTPEDEAAIRHTAKKINEKIVEFKTSFAGKDMQDYIAMVILWFATQQQAPAAEVGEDALLRIDKISSALQGALGE